MQLEDTQAQALEPAAGESVNIPGITIDESIQLRPVGARREEFVRASFIWPALLVVLALSIFPLIISLYLSLSTLQFVTGGFDIRFIGLENYRQLFFGINKSEFLGVSRQPSLLGWVVFLGGTLTLVWLWILAVRGGAIGLVGLVLRALGILFAAALLWLAVTTLAQQGRPGALLVTLIYG